MQLLVLEIPDVVFKIDHLWEPLIVKPKRQKNKFEILIDDLIYSIIKTIFKLTHNYVKR